MPRAARAISSSPSWTRPSASTASIRSPSPSKAKPISAPSLDHLALQRLDVGGAAAVVDVAAVGLDRRSPRPRRRAARRSPGRPCRWRRWRSRGRRGGRRGRAGRPPRARAGSPRGRRSARAPGRLCGARRGLADQRFDPRLELVVELGAAGVEELDPVVARRGCGRRRRPRPGRGRAGGRRIAAAGVGSTPPSSASPPAAAIPAASAASSIGPDSRVSRTIRTCGRSASSAAVAARPSAVASSAREEASQPPLGPRRSRRALVAWVAIVTTSLPISSSKRREAVQPLDEPNANACELRLLASLLEARPCAAP